MVRSFAFEKAHSASATTNDHSDEAPLSDDPPLEQLALDYQVTVSATSRIHIPHILLLLFG